MIKFIFILLSVSLSAQAHQNSVTDNGKKMFLPDPRINILLENSSSYVSQNTTRDIVSEVLAAWNQQSNHLQMNLGETTKFKIRFENDFSRYGSAVVGVTEINYNKEGAIQRATIKLNNNMHLSTTKAAHNLGSIYLGDVLSHEIGHLIGLNHSEVLNASMFFESFPGQHTLSQDDVAGVRTLYGPAGGRISGTVMGGKSIPVLGAQVKAISRISGQAISTVSDEYGRFVVEGLDLNDSYYLYISPTLKVNDLPPYYANTQNNFCPTTYQGGFFTACGISERGSAQSIVLTSQQRSVDVGVVSISCSLRSSPEYANAKLEEEPESLVIWEASENVYEKNHIGYFFKSADWSKWDKFRLDLRNVNNGSNNRYLKINLIAYPFGNPLEYELKIVRNGVEVDTLKAHYNSILETFNTNISYDLFLADPDDYEVHVRARNLSVDCYVEDKICRRWIYPALDLFTGARALPYLLSMGVMEGVSPLFNTEVLMSDNRSCLEAPFTYEVQRNIASQSDEPPAKTAEQMSCGTIEPPSQNPPAGGGLMTMCLGFMLASLALVIKKNKNTLS